MSAQLTQIGTMPPLSQSKFEDMACSALYLARHIEGRKSDSEPARRGHEIHEAIAEYVEHLVRTRRKTDYEKLAELAASCGDEAREILQRFSESWFIDPETVFGTEVYIAAVSDERGIYPVLDKEGSRVSREEIGMLRGNVFEGTLDLVTLDSPTEATIYDWKSYFQIVDADTFQSKLYPLLLFCLNPKLERVRFVLSFVRYGDAQRDVTYTRSDVPKLKKLAERERARQLELHAYPGTDWKATPGRHCVWCPLMAGNECPVARTNPYATMKAEERVAFAIWLSAAKKENDRVLKSLMVEGGPISYQDANGTAYLAEFAGVVKKFYPLPTAGPIIHEYATQHEDDSAFIEKLTVGGLSSPLKAKKRAELVEHLAAIAEERAETRLKIAAVDDEDDK